jgi:hypothetical protein
MTLTMRDLLELRLAGKPLPPVDERNARRVYCPECLDDGVIRVWHPRTVDEARKLVAEDKPLTELRTHYTAIAACTCRVGDSWHQRDVKGGGVRTLLTRFGETNFCRLRHSTKHPEDHAALVEWLANWRPANYTRDFDQFNATGYVNQEIQF